MRKTVFISIVILLIIIMFFFLGHTKDSWYREQQKEKRELIKETTYIASFSNWGTKRKDIEIHPKKDGVYTFTYEMKVNEGEMCISLGEVGKKSEPKEACTNKSGTFDMPLEKKKTYHLRVSGDKAKNGYVHVSWEEK